MKEKHIQISVQEFESSSELNKEEQHLLEKAWEEVDHAYAPYSHFHVAAAVLLDNGEVICGTNQENAAYPSGLCAERVAIFSAISNQPGAKIKTIAIVAKPEDFKLESPVTPCGSCRQVIAEYEFRQDNEIDIIMDGGQQMIYKTHGIRNLLPLAFYNEELKKKK